MAKQQFLSMIQEILRLHKKSWVNTSVFPVAVTLSRTCQAISMLYLPILLSGCALTPSPTTPQTCNTHAIRQHQQSLKKLHDWEVSGTLKTQKDGKNLKTRFMWNSNKNLDTLTLLSPFHTPVATITIKTNGQMSIDGPKRKLNTKQTQTWLKQHFQEPPPIQLIHLWLIGRSKNTATHSHCSQAKSLYTKNWHVTWHNYQCHNGYSLPQQIKLRQQHLSVEFKINEWQTTKGDDPLCLIQSK